ncbi:MAG: hypothetical protein ACOX6J_04445 [Oscillospiraceae bacterium]|jgi:hypothetical protein
MDMSKKGKKFVRFMIGAAVAAGTVYAIKKAVDDGRIGKPDSVLYGSWKETENGSVWDFGPTGTLEVNGKVCRYTARKGLLRLIAPDGGEDVFYNYFFEGDELVLKSGDEELRFTLSVGGDPQDGE